MNNNEILTKILPNRVKLMQDFFFRVKHWSILICFIVFALTAIVSGLTVQYEDVHIILGCITAIAFLLFLLSILSLFNKSISREEVEVLMAYDRQFVYDELFKNLAIEKSKSKYQTDPIEIVCPEVYPKMNAIVYRFFRYFNKTYYSQVGYSWLFFGEKSMYYFHASVNHIYGYNGYEVSQEFDYKDIVSIKTAVKHEDDVESFVVTLTLTNGEALDIALRTRPNESYTSTHKLSEKEEKILTTIRSVIRNSK